MADETEANVPKARRRWWWAAVIVLLVLLFPVVLIVCLPHIVTGERMRVEAVSALTDVFGAPVAIDRIEYAPFSGVEIDRITIGPPPGFSENVLTIERIAVHYALGGILSRRVVVSEIRLVDPVFTVETQGNLRNIDVILARLSGEPAGGEKVEEDAPSREPLLPIDVDLNALEIGAVTVRLTGDGPNAKIEGAKLAIDGHAGRERLDVKLAFTVDPKEAENVAIAIPAELAAGRLLDLRSRFSFELAIDVAAETSAGLALERVAVHVASGSRVAALWGDEVVDPAELAARIGLLVEPKGDRAKLESAEVKLDGAPLLVARAELDGIAALVGALAGDALVRALGGSIGLVDQKRSGKVDFSIDRVHLPLGRFERWARMFVPDLKLGGTIDLAPLRVSGNAREIAAGTPPELELALKLDRLSANLPSAQLSLGSFGGSITGTRNEAGRYAFTGAFEAESIRQAKNRIADLSLGLEAIVDRLSYPEQGKTDAKVALALNGVDAAPLRTKRAEVSAAVSGLDPLVAERANDPIAARVELEVPSARIVQSSTSAIDLAGVKLAVDAAIDRLLEPAIDPIGAQVALSIGKVALGREQSVERASLRLDAKVGDPRKGPFDAEAKLEAKVGRASAAPIAVRDLKVNLAARASDVRERSIRGFPGGAPPMMPAKAAVKLSLFAPSVALSDRQLGDVATPLAVDVALSADPVAATANLEKLTVELRDALTARAKGRAAKLYGSEPWIDGELDVGPVHLGAIAAKIPKGLLEAAPDLSAEGKLELSARAKGTIPSQFAKTALVKQPIEGHVRLALDGVGAQSKRAAIALSNLNGAIIAEIGGGKVETRTELDAARIVQGRAPLENQIDKLTVRNQVKLEDEIWTVASHVLAASVRSAFGGKGAVEGASIDLDLTYPLGGDLELARFDVNAPGNGVEMAVNGRLRRRAFGVFRPDLSVRADLDFDRLRHLLPLLAGGKGKASLALKVASRSDRLVDVEGSVAAEKFSWEVPHVLTVLNASGRLPVSQRILLPAPKLDLEVARSIGALGDDFEARASEMLRHFERGKGLLATEDILVEAPRSADYQTLRPHYAKSGARLTIDGIVYRAHAIEDVVLEGMYSSGVLRVDRLACRLWEGDVLGDLAVQLTPDHNVRMRLRGTITDLNVDLPYAIIKGVEPVTDPDDKKDYRVSGQMDLEFALKQRAVNARIELTKLQLPLIQRVFATMDLPERAQSALEMAQLVGVRPTSGKIWISNNLLNVNFDWQRLWLHASLDQERFLGKALDVVLIPFRPLLIPTLGGYVINTVNETIKDFSVSAVLDDLAGQMRVEDQLQFLEGRVIAADRAGTPSGLPNEASADMLSPR